MQTVNQLTTSTATTGTAVPEEFATALSKPFAVSVVAVFTSINKQKQNLQTLLQVACLEAYGTAPKEVAKGITLLWQRVEACKALDATAFARWVREYAPVYFDKGTNTFLVSKQKRNDFLATVSDVKDAAALQSSFWAFQTEKGATANWFDMHPEAAAKATSEFDPVKLNAQLAALIKKCTKEGFDDAARILSKVQANAVAAAQLAAAKHAA